MLRGKALRDAFILRLLAAERFIRGVLLVALAYGVYQFNGAQDSLEQVFNEYLPTLKPFADKLGIDLQNTGPVRADPEGARPPSTAPWSWWRSASWRTAPWSCSRGSGCG